MSKKHKQNHGKPPAGPVAPKAATALPADVTARPTPVSPAEAAIREAHGEALTAAADKDLEAIGTDPRPQDATLDSLWTLVREARDIFRSATDRAAQAAEDARVAADHVRDREADLDNRDEQCKEREQAVREAEQRLAEEQNALAERRRLAEAKEAANLQMDSDLRAREANAAAGFLRERATILEPFEQALESRREAVEAVEREIDAKRTAWHQEAERARADVRKELDDRRAALTTEMETRGTREQERLAKRERDLDQREADLESRRREVDAARRRVEFDADDLKDLRADLNRRIEEAVAAIREKYEHRLDSLEAQLEQARADRDRLDATLRDREAADRKFGQRTPDEVLRELDALRGENERLAHEVAERPDAAAAVRLEELARDQANWEAEKVEMSRRIIELQRRLATHEIDLADRETLRDELETMKKRRELLQKAHDQVRAEIDHLIGRSQAESPFPACVAMDRDATLQAPGPTEPVKDLRAFVEDLRLRIAHDPDHPERRLYYADEDLRSFLAGLAMSPLTLLQGISGTGKTSLPIAFARAVGTVATVVEVQAGWRDPQDLTGHYNVFEKRFYEKEFLKALYRAQTPRWEDTIQIVLLDEMNLSHPEQYFSDLLSALELRVEDRRLVLMTHPLESAPTRFVEGSKLWIPENVWFVGTANHDETTKDFADKTYDRSHVMQFPEQPAPFKVERPDPRPPISYRSIRDAFDEAERKWKGDAEKAIEFLDGQVRQPLAAHFGVGWGPRLERQMRRYVPVVVAAGGSVGEATDHVLAMRLLRKAKNRHDNRPEHVTALKQRILEAWRGLDPKRPPTRSLSVLNAELQRLGLSADEIE